MNDHHNNDRRERFFINRPFLQFEKQLDEIKKNILKEHHTEAPRQANNDNEQES